MAAIVIIILLGKQQKINVIWEAKYVSVNNPIGFGGVHQQAYNVEKRSIILDSMPFRRRIHIGYLYKLLSMREIYM